MSLRFVLNMICCSESISVICNCGNIWTDYIIPIVGSIGGSVLGAFLGFWLAKHHEKKKEDELIRSNYLNLLNNLKREIEIETEKFSSDDKITKFIINYDGTSSIFIPLLEKAFMSDILYRYIDKDEQSNKLGESIIKDLKKVQVHILQVNKRYLEAVDYWKNNKYNMQGKSIIRDQEALQKINLSQEISEICQSCKLGCEEIDLIAKFQHVFTFLKEFLNACQEAEKDIAIYSKIKGKG